MSNWIELRQKLFIAFADTPRPDLASIPVIGCCEKHEQDFDWYRHHTWQDFETAIETRGFDSADFVAIHPLAFHYFTPGVMSAALRRLSTDPEKDWNDESWIRHYIVPPSQTEKFKKEYLPHFDLKQRQAISETLEWYREWFLSQHGYDYDELDDGDQDIGRITNAIKLVWQSKD